MWVTGALLFQPLPLLAPIPGAREDHVFFRNKGKGKYRSELPKLMTEGRISGRAESRTPGSSVERMGEGT